MVRLIVVGLATCAVVVACTRDVRNDRFVQGGDGGVGAGGQTGGAGEGGLGYGGFTMGTVCERACESLVVCDGLDVRCGASCETISDGPCGAEHQTWLMCALDEPGHLCGLGTSFYCNEELEAYLTCADRVVIEDDCFTDNDPGWCYCGGDFLPDVRAETVCQGNGCSCRIDEVQVGTCTADEDQCGVDNGCCVGVFYTFDR